jgi:proteasome alpha subunit
MVVEVGAAGDENRIFRVTYDGTLYDHRRVAAIGGLEDELVAALESRFRPDAPLPEAIGWARDAFQEQAERPLEREDWEGAVLDRTLGRRTFRRLGDDELAGQ